MKQQIISWRKIPLLLLACGLLLTVAVAQTNSAKQLYSGTDTIPGKQKKIRDLDDALAEIDRSEQEVQRALRTIDKEKINREIKAAMETMEKDMSKMSADMENAMKEIDQQKIEAELQKAMKEIERATVKKSLTRADREKLRREMQRAKEGSLKEMKKNLERIQPQMEKAMKEARLEMGKAREEIMAYKNLVSALQNDGLLRKGENYKIVYKDGGLTVNGRTLSAEAAKKYKEYLGNKKDFTLQKNEEGLEIEN